VNSTVPGNIDEADQGAVLVGADPAETVALKSFSPVGLGDRGTEAVGVQGVEGGVVEVPPPLVLDRHSPIVVTEPRSVLRWGSGGDGVGVVFEVLSATVETGRSMAGVDRLDRDLQCPRLRRREDRWQGRRHHLIVLAQCDPIQQSRPYVTHTVESVWTCGSDVCGRGGQPAERACGRRASNGIMELRP